MSRPTEYELNQIADFKKSFGFAPNLVTDIYKNRRGRWNMVRIWSVQDLGTCRKQDLFITTANLKNISDFIVIDFTAYDEEKWHDYEDLYNTGEVSEEICETMLQENDIDLLPDLKEAFGNLEDKKQRLINTDWGELL